MRPWLRIIIVALLAVTLAPLPALAQTPEPTPEAPAEATPTPEPPLAPIGDIIGFDQLTESEQSLYGPYDARYFSIRLPATWELEPGASLRLDFSTFIGGNQTGAMSTTFGLGGNLNITFNNVNIAQVVLDQAGERSLTIPISDTALIPLNADGSHSLGILLDAGLHCSSDFQTNVVLRNSSILAFPHEDRPLPLDLQRLPQPLFQQSLEEDQALLVVPDAPSAAELRAAIITAAALSRQTFGEMPFTLVPESDVSASDRAANHLVFVGQPGSFAEFEAIDWSAPWRGQGFAAPAYEAGDGIIQLAASPWSPTRAVLLISGDSDAAVLKAAQALSTERLDPATPEVAVVAEVRSDEMLTQTLGITDTAVITDGEPLRPRLSDLGYPTQTAFGLGAHFFEYVFILPSGVEMADDGMVEVSFAHSNLLNYDAAGMLVRLNDQPLGSIRLSEESSQQGLVQLRVPRNVVQPGPNTLLFSADLVPQTPCIDPNLAGVWIALYADTRITMPLRPAATASRAVLKLSEFDRPLLDDRTLDALTFVVDDQPESWNIAAQLAGNLARPLPRGIMRFDLQYPDTLPEEALHESDLIMIGLPAAFPQLAALAETLPAPFPPGENQPIFGNSRVVYRIPPDASRGYLELVRSPANPDRVVLGVWGSTTEGVVWSGAALLRGVLRAQLNGTIAVVNNERIQAQDTTLTGDTSTLVDEGMTDGSLPPALREPPPLQRPGWILPVIAVSLTLMWMILGLVGIRAFRQRRRQR